MAPTAADPERILAAAGSLTPLRERCEAGASDLLGHFAVLGERRVQTAVDRLVDGAADLLLGLSNEAAELALSLRGAAANAAVAEDTVGRSFQRRGRPGMPPSGSVPPEPILPEPPIHPEPPSRSWLP